MLQTEKSDTASTTKIGCYYKLVGYSDKCSAYQAEWSFNRSVSYLLRLFYLL